MMPRANQFCTRSTRRNPKSSGYRAASSFRVEAETGKPP
jgi:hypothetical protein